MFVSFNCSYTDSSGLRLYYTPHIRTYDQNIVLMGQNQIEIPPMVEDTLVEGTCHSECMIMPHPLNLTDILIHMHYLGEQ